ncbi:SDR family oxidoreductase [Actinophytocola oryzae]|uniref:SDR family oxidoreductase n=1 Tax=Actinophytocola oryzae TaxID=502181 RepID=UPI0010637C80|nr:SDR family NAD(P)-dependent oxidoreductase [Actinophytocola oryzae]
MAEREGDGQSPRVALVTGAGGGLGGECVRTLLAHGLHVFASDLTTDLLGGLDAGEAPGRLSLRALDVTDPAAVDALVADVLAEGGRLDVLVNLAGVVRNQVLHKIADTDFGLTISTHVLGTMHTMRAAAPAMRSARYGRIVNMSSIAVRGSIAGSAYGAAKGAIEGMTRAAAMELAPHGVTVNCVAPGVVDAGMFRTVPKDYQEQSVARVPMRRPGTAREVADVVAFFSSPAAGYVTGQSLFVCGGLSLGF